MPWLLNLCGFFVRDDCFAIIWLAWGWEREVDLENILVWRVKITRNSARIDRNFNDFWEIDFSFEESTRERAPWMSKSQVSSNESFDSWRDLLQHTSFWLISLPQKQFKLGIRTIRLSHLSFLSIQLFIHHSAVPTRHLKPFLSKTDRKRLLSHEYRYFVSWFLRVFRVSNRKDFKKSRNSLV